MKKITKIALAATILTSALNADVVKHFGVTAINSDVKLENADKFTEYGVNFGATKYFDSNILLGVDASVTFGSMDFSSNGQTESILMTGVAGDVKAGYSFFDRKVDLYATIGFAGQGFDNGESNAAGFGYGAGVQYNFAQHWAVAADYKKYDMDFEGLVDYDLNRVGVTVKYLF